MSKMITVVVDTNDADYMTKVSEIDDEELVVVREVAAKIKTFKPYEVSYERYDGTTGDNACHHNWPEGDCQRDDMGEKSPIEIYDLTEEQYEIFDCYTPYSEYGFHTIESITIVPITKVESLL